MGHPANHHRGVRGGLALGVARKSTSSRAWRHYRRSFDATHLPENWMELESIPGSPSKIDEDEDDVDLSVEVSPDETDAEEGNGLAAVAEAGAEAAGRGPNRIRIRWRRVRASCVGCVLTSGAFPRTARSRRRSVARCVGCCTSARTSAPRSSPRTSSPCFPASPSRRYGGARRRNWTPSGSTRRQSRWCGRNRWSSMGTFPGERRRREPSRHRRRGRRRPRVRETSVLVSCRTKSPQHRSGAQVSVVCSRTSHEKSVFDNTSYFLVTLFCEIRPPPLGRYSCCAGAAAVSVGPRARRRRVDARPTDESIFPSHARRRARRRVPARPRP